MAMPTPSQSEIVNVLVAGGFTIHSAGDDASLSAFMSLVEGSPQFRSYSDFRYRVLARHPDTAFDKAFNVESTSNLEYPDKEASIGRFFLGFNLGDDDRVLLSLVKEFEWADAVVLGAGNFINGNSFGLFRGLLPQLAVYVWLAKLTKTPCMLYGMSASTLSSELSVRMANWVLESADVVSFREASSVSCLSDCGVKVPQKVEIVCDPVLSAPGANRELADQVLESEGISKIADESNVLAVAPREIVHRSKEEHENLVKMLASVCDWWVSKGGEILFIPHCTYDKDISYRDDRVVCEQIRSSMKDGSKAHSIKKHHWPWEIESLYYLCQAALCVRLHAGVFSAKCGTPTVALGYEPKVTGFWTSIGYPRSCLPLESSMEDIVLRLEEMMSNVDRKDLRDRVSTFGRVSGRYAELFFEMIDAKKDPT